MRTLKILRAGWVAALLVLAASAPAAAQFGSFNDGQYQILRARYGTERNNVDVTARLQEFIRQGQPFRMGNSTFGGVDPAPGEVKILRIEARERNGRTRVFEYREGSTVDGSQFSGWGSAWGSGGGSQGGWGGGNSSGQYEILEARYGTARNNVIVTARLQQLARQGDSFRMGNSTFGIDPDPGQVKSLRIYTRGPDRRPRMFEFREGSTVDGSLFSGWRTANWGRGGEYRGGWGGGNNESGQYQILEARYGTEHNSVDVTARLQQIARQDNSFRMGNSTFGVDPAPGQVKTLRIYTRGPDGRPRTFEFREGSTVDGSLFSGWRSGNWGNGGRR
jgi:hypothetical protein